jgi:hypothetical protein
MNGKEGRTGRLDVIRGKEADSAIEEVKMKRVLLVVLLASLVFALCLATMSHADAGSKPPFRGRWETIDTESLATLSSGA